MSNKKKSKTMSNNEIDPKLVKKIIDCAIAILTAIGGFLVGMGSATACTIF